MKPIIVLLLLSAFPASMAQTERGARVSFDVGNATVWLGMTKHDALKNFNSLGYQITDRGDTLLVQATGSHDVLIVFKNDQLIFASQDWYAGGGTETLEAVLGALGALADKAGRLPCIVRNSPLSAPSTSVQRVYVSCGHRSVLISKGVVQGEQVRVVSLRIGGAAPND